MRLRRPRPHQCSPIPEVTLFGRNEWLDTDEHGDGGTNTWIGVCACPYCGQLWSVWDNGQAGNSKRITMECAQELWRRFMEREQIIPHP